MNRYYLQIVLSLIPIIAIAGCLAITKNKTLKDEQKIASRFNKLSDNVAEKTISKFVKKDKEEKTNFVQGLFAKMRVFGIDFNIEKLAIICIVGYIACALASYFIIGAGPLLMLYIGIIFLAVVYVVITNHITKKKRDIRDEFMEKLRDISSHMAVGLNFQMALEEAIKSPQTSSVIIREFNSVSNSIYTGKSMSEAFLDMYNRLKIKEIKDFASVLEIFEVTGGKLSDFMNSYDESYMANQRIEDEKDVFLSSLKSSQKFIIGVPVLVIIGFGLMSPGTMKSYYGSIEGQMVGIALITVIIAGSIFSIKFIGGDD